MKTEKLLFSRYDADDVTDKITARNMFASVIGHLSPCCTKVLYRKTDVYKAHRTQTNFYDLDEAIKLFVDKINGKDKRFMESRKKYLKILIELRGKKVEVLKIERGV